MIFLGVFFTAGVRQLTALAHFKVFLAKTRYNRHHLGPGLKNTMLCLRQRASVLFD